MLREPGFTLSQAAFGADVCQSMTVAQQILEFPYSFVRLLASSLFSLLSPVKPFD
jgi:hypothetical protein